MSVILRNEYGAIAVNKGVIEKIIIEDLLDMSDRLSLCSKKGKIIRGKGSRLVDPDYYDALEVYEKRQVVRVKVFIVTEFGRSISGIADEIFGKIENDFELLKLDKPGVISVNIRGVQTESQMVRRNIEIVRNNR